jgi:nicotinamide-nucleotide amidase
MTQGIGESFLADQITDWEERVASAGFGLAYLPSPGMVKLRLTSYEGVKRKSEILSFFGELKQRFPRYVFGEQDMTLSEVLGRILRDTGKTISTVESCTGGALANSLVTIPGSSDYFLGSLITYSNALKMQLADVSEVSLNTSGAVSADVVAQMAANGRLKLGTDYCVATSGIAGPDGGSEEKPVGTVWMAVADEQGVSTHCFRYGDNRERNIQMSVLSALNLVRCRILAVEIEKK